MIADQIVGFSFATEHMKQCIFFDSSTGDMPSDASNNTKKMRISMAKGIVGLLGQLILNHFVHLVRNCLIFLTFSFHSDVFDAENV